MVPRGLELYNLTYGLWTLSETGYFHCKGEKTVLASNLDIEMKAKHITDSNFCLPVDMMIRIK